MSKPVQVLDASALLALINQEAGAAEVKRLLAVGDLVMCTVNFCEVVGKIADAGKSVDEFVTLFDCLAIDLIDFDRQLAVAAGEMKKQTVKLGLSIGDRACLALAARLDAPAITADTEWKKLKGVKIHAIR